MTGWTEYPPITAKSGAVDAAPMADLLDVPANPPPGRRKPGKRLRIETPSQARKAMVATYRGMADGSLDVNKGTKLIYALVEISRCLEREEVERLTARLNAAEGR